MRKILILNLFVVIMSGSMQQEDLIEFYKKIEWEIEYYTEFENDALSNQEVIDGFTFLKGYAQMLAMSGTGLTKLTAG